MVEYQSLESWVGSCGYALLNLGRLRSFALDGSPGMDEGERKVGGFLLVSPCSTWHNLCLQSLEKQVASHPCVLRSEVSQLQGSMVVSCAMVRGPWPLGVVLVGTSLPSATASTSSAAMTQSVEPWSAKCRDSLPEVDMLSALRSRRLWEVLTRCWFGEV